jgi:hypothetical protein
MINTPDSDASVREWAEYYDDSGDRTLSVVHGYAWALAGIAFLVFVSAVRERMRAAADWLGTLAFASGIAFVALLMTGAAAMAAVAGGIEFGDVPQDAATGEFGRWFEQLGFGMLLLCGMMAAGVFVVAASVALKRAGAIPGWLAVSGYVVGPIIFVFGVLFVPQVLLLLWMLIVGIVLLVRGEGSVAATP